MAKKKLDWKVLGATLLAGLAVILSAGALVKANRAETTETLGATSFTVAVVEADGCVDEDGVSSIVSKMIKLDGLKVELVEKSEVTYQLHWYDKGEDYISSTAELSVNFDVSSTVIPDEAKYAIVEVTPVDDEDGEISFLEKFEYLDSITVTVNK